MYKLNANQSCLGQKCVAVFSGQGQVRKSIPRIVLMVTNLGHRAVCNEYNKTKVISLINHNRRKQYNKPIRTQSKFMQPAPSAGKRAQASHDLYQLCFSRVYRTKQSQNKSELL